MANNVKILSIATALPPQELAQEQAFALARQFNCKSEGEFRVLQKLYKRTTIQNRRTVLSLTKSLNPYTLAAEPGTAARMAIYKKEAPALAIEAAAAALAKVSLSPERIGNLVTVSCTGFFAPGIDTHLIEKLSLSRSVGRTNVGFMGCSGALNGLRAAAALTKANHTPTLLVAAELCSLHFQYGCKSDDVLANALFGDGAAAALLVPGDYHQSPVELNLCRVLASGSYLVTGTEQAMTWEVGDHGFQMTLDAVQEALALEDHMLAPSRQILSQLGNMSSPTILFIVDEILSRVGENEKNALNGPLVALAFGPGLSIEAAILEIFSAV